ncbi:H-NS family nucleoid-associated regulatory protein [Burkholderia stabilis]|uniref:H-NS family nucleoid-associated regulatory protein n=1 Tax=Burkholderia stabilis TaxID=95485 RepID=UPI0009F48B9E|nr:H-NS histone family protein [Burkholderia stabilis]HDR9528065.1 H-NS histone family protein [Burkholderia stabilis]HDR9532860.1 H-NS histone family protein [Burkholderia stabilis]HDR9542929.1 H-NS histone family protein [Burkholderia stabilis]HDR9544769.1 H-NS histone family protein [Burkholderia stabilis]
MAHAVSIANDRGARTADGVSAIAPEQLFGRRRAAATTTSTPVASKYRAPKTGATWSGRGRAPQWIAGAKNRDRFLIEQ